MAKIKTVYHTFKDVPVHWAKVFKWNRETEGLPANQDRLDAMEGQYAIDVDFTEKGKVFPTFKKKTGSSKSYKTRLLEEDDIKRVTFTRPHVAYTKAGDLMDWRCGPPKVAYKGKPWKDSNEGDEPEFGAGFISNESVADVEVAVIQGLTGRDDNGDPIDYTITYLVSVNVKEHILFEQDSDDDEEDVNDSNQIDDDEIPF